MPRDRRYYPRRLRNSGIILPTLLKSLSVSAEDEEIVRNSTAIMLAVARASRIFLDYTIVLCYGKGRGAQQYSWAEVVGVEVTV